MATRKTKMTQGPLTRLCENADFKLWFAGILDELCAFEQGFGCHDEFAQGKRAAGSFMVASLARGGNAAAKMMSEIYEEHFRQQMKPIKKEEK